MNTKSVKPAAAGRVTDLESTAMDEITIVGGKTYRYTLIELGEGGYAKIKKDPWHLYFIEFVGQLPEEITSKEGQSRLSGKFTSSQLTIWALRDYCRDKGIPMSLSHWTADGRESLSVNPEAL